MNIAILFGSFDPPHLGHYLIAHQVKELIKVDQVWVMSDFSHPFNKKLTDPLLRLKKKKKSLIF
jgi:nicotinate-nucleotide adenylyltransferase